VPNGANMQSNALVLQRNPMTNTMTDFIKSIIVDFWSTIAEMSPYLLFGFFVAGILSVLVSQRLVEKHLGGRAFGSPDICNPGQKKTGRLISQ